MTGFRTNMNKGFQVEFPNAVVVSVQFGACNYCDNKNLKMNPEDFTHPKDHECANAEVALFLAARDESPETRGWLTKEWKDEGDDVVGYQTPDDVLSAMIWAQKYKAEK